MLAILTVAQSAYAANGTIMIKPEADTPIQITSVEVVSGAWGSSPDLQTSIYWEDNISAVLIIVGIKVERAIPSRAVTLSADYQDSSDKLSETQFYFNAIKKSAAPCVNCERNATPIDLSPNFFQDERNGRRELQPNATYYATFLMPKSLARSGREFNHITIKVADKTSVASGGMWIFYKGGDRPNVGISWAPMGLQPKDGHILLQRVGNSNNWTISS